MPFTIERNDLAAVAVDAIVVAANERLQITGGVGLTVARAAGLDELQAACDEIGYCPCGSAVATPAFGLQAKIVVHAVGPVWQGGGLGEADFLRSAYDAALDCAVGEGARSIALPLISAGTYGFPADVSLAVARESIRAFLNRRDDIEVRLVLYSRESVTAGMAAYLDIAEYVDDHYVDDHSAWGRQAQSIRDWREERLATAENPDGAPAGAAPRAAARTPIEIPAPSAQAPKQGGRGPLGRLGSALTERRRKRKTGEAARSASGSEAVLEDSRCEREADAAWSADALETACADDWRERELADAALPSADFGAAMPMAEPAPSFDGAVMPDMAFAGRKDRELTELLNSLDAPFSTTLLALIDERGMTDAQVYKRANMSRQLFSKIRSNESYRPTKKTALALAIALGLDLDETHDLLARAGFALSASSKADVIVEYFIAHGNYDIFEINEALYAFDQPLL